MFFRWILTCFLVLMVQRHWREWRPGQDKVLNNANEDSVSMLLLKANSCHVALLSDANAGRATTTKKKASEFDDVAFLHKKVSSQFVESIGIRDRHLCLKHLPIWNADKTQVIFGSGNGPQSVNSGNTMIKHLCSSVLSVASLSWIFSAEFPQVPKSVPGAWLLGNVPQIWDFSADCYSQV